MTFSPPPCSTGRTPIVHKAWRLEPEGTNPNLDPVKLRGNVDFDPRRDDLFKVLPEQRQIARHDAALAESDRDRTSRFLKVMGNSVGFGIYVQLDRDDTRTKPVPIEVHTGDDKPYRTTTTTPERPGAYCLPPVAAALTGAARLMLALLERSVTDARGCFAFCDTDSMAIVSTRSGRRTKRLSTEIPVLSWKQVDEIVTRFETLNPYDRDVVPGSILEYEKENFTPRTKQRRELRCFAISAKRYQLTNTRGRPREVEPARSRTPTQPHRWHPQGIRRPGLGLRPQSTRDSLRVARPARRQSTLHHFCPGLPLVPQDQRRARLHRPRSNRSTSCSSPTPTRSTRHPPQAPTPSPPTTATPTPGPILTG